MLSFLKVNESLRLVLMIILLLACRMAIWTEMPLTVLDIKWQILAQRLNEGKSMYVDIIDDTAPLAAGVYWLLFKFFGQSLWAYQILATFLVIVQALVLNRIFNRKNLYEERNYLPTLFYFVAMSISFDFINLSPSLMCLTFLVIIISNILSLDEVALDESVLNTGILMGLAILVHLPSIFLLGFVVLGFAVFRTVSFRQFMLLGFGMLLVLGITSMYYTWIGGFEEFLRHFVLTIFKVRFISEISLPTLLAILALPVFFLILGIVKTFAYNRFINYQSSCRFLMLVWVFFAGISMFFNYRFSGGNLVLFAPAFVYFSLYLVQLIERRWLRELFFLVFVASLLSLSFLAFYKNEYVREYFDFEQLLISKENKIKNKRILVLGNSIDLYYQNKLASPYFNWELSKFEFRALDYYSNLVEVYKKFEKDRPQVIIDQQNIVPKLFKRIPILEKYYHKDTAMPSVYWLKEEFLEKKP